MQEISIEQPKKFMVEFFGISKNECATAIGQFFDARDINNKPIMDRYDRFQRNYDIARTYDEMG